MTNVFLASGWRSRAIGVALLFSVSLWLWSGVAAWAMPLELSASGLSSQSSQSVARLEQHQEAPGRVLYKSFTTLHDQAHRPWRAIAFNYSLPDGSHTFQLRLVGFPGTVSVDRTRSLKIKTALGQTFTRPDTASQLFPTDREAEPNVVQYDLQSLALRLTPPIPLRLFIPLNDSKTARILVPPGVLQEWRSVALGAADAAVWE